MTLKEAENRKNWPNYIIWVSEELRESNRGNLLHIFSGSKIFLIFWLWHRIFALTWAFSSNQRRIYNNFVPVQPKFQKDLEKRSYGDNATFTVTHEHHNFNTNH